MTDVGKEWTGLSRTGREAQGARGTVMVARGVSVMSPQRTQ